MKLGTQIGLGRAHIVLDGDPAPPPEIGAVPLWGRGSWVPLPQRSTAVNGLRFASLSGHVPGEPKKIPPTTFVDITAMHGNFCTKFYTIVKRSNIHFITKFY